MTGYLLEQGFQNVQAVDIKPLARWFQLHASAKNLTADLRDKATCDAACRGAAAIYNFASDMGGMGFIESHKADCMLSVLINTQLLTAAHDMGVPRLFFASSACVYPLARQNSAMPIPLREDDAYPADPEDGYGWEKLFSERMCRHFREDFGLVTRIARYHNVYGPKGSYTGGREKAPAAICRKVIEAKLSGASQIEIWGDGEQTRSFLFIDDCLSGTQALLNSGCEVPVNLGSSELVTINQLVDMVESIASVKLRRHYRLDAPMGVRGRNSDNSLAKKEFGWEPSTPLRKGLEATYRWIFDQMRT